MSSCECDEPTPILPRIPAGLDALPRQLRSFPDVREALLRSLPSKAALRHWQARGERDLGLMWLEMWAYVADVLAFYDERIANESYLRTAQRRPSLRRLIELLGYIQQPGIAGEATLALTADGRQPVTLPAGTAFRSDAFEGETPQVFEIGEKTVIHPFKNEWRVGPIRKDQLLLRPTPSQEEIPGSFSATETRFLVFQPSDFGLAKDQIVVFQIDQNDLSLQNRVSRVKDFKTIKGPDGSNFVEVELADSVQFPAGISASAVKVLTPRLTARPTQNQIVEPGLVDPSSPLETDAIFTIPASPATSTIVVLDAPYPQLRAGEIVVFSVAGDFRPEISTADEVRQVQVALPPAPAPAASSGPLATATVKNPDGSVASTVEVSSNAPPPPPPTVSVTMIRIPTLISDVPSRPALITVHFGLTQAGTLTTVPIPEITVDDMSGNNRLPILGRQEVPPDASFGELVQTFLLRDVDNLGAFVHGSVRFRQSGSASFVRHTPAQGEEELVPEVLKAPLTLFGNVVTATRGESVFNEVLGSGDPRIPNQEFSLRKKPLTYLNAPTDPRGFTSTLLIRVNGVEWSEVKSFFGRGPEDQVYIVRHDDDQETIITFGDGVRGSRVPAGIENVVANYRFGSGEKAPPAGAIQQIARPVEGLSDVASPIAAKRGRNPDSNDQLRTSAPRSLLTLGRAVSVPDFEALAQQESGVLKAVAEFSWIAAEQRAGVKVLVIGDKTKVEERLRSQSDPNLPLEVKEAQALASTLGISIGVDPRFEPDVVAKAVKDLLIDDQTGLLSRRNASIGGQFWTSQLFRIVLSVPGVVEVQSATLSEPTQGQHFLQSEDVVCIPAESYFDFGDGEGVSVNPTEPIGTVTGLRRVTEEGVG